MGAKNRQRVNAKTGKPLRFELLLASGGNVSWVLPFQHNLQRLGVTMDIRQVDNSQANSRLRSRDYDMMPSLWRATARQIRAYRFRGPRTILTPAITRRECRTRRSTR